MVALLLAASVATNSVADLGQVVVYASRTYSAAENIPAQVKVISSAEIESSGARDLPELLSKSANIDVRTLNANPLQSHVAMRGFGENSFGRVKIVVDGDEINNVDMEAPDLAGIPIGSIERVEIIHGPSPVLYGDGAVAGVINVTTDSRSYEKRTRITAKGGSHGTFGANFLTRGGFEDEGITYSAAYDYLRSDGFRERSGYDLHSANASLRKNFANGSTAGIRTTYRNGFYRMPGYLSYHDWKHDRRTTYADDDWCRLWSYGLALDSRLLVADDQWIYLDGSFSRKHRKTNWGDYNSSTDYDLYAYSLSPRYVSENDVFGFGSKFTIGTDLRYDHYIVNDRMPTESVFDRFRSAIFAHEEFFLLENLSIVAGARLENINNRWANSPGTRESGNDDWAGDYELGLVYLPFDGLKTYAKGTRFHRSAFCDEMNYTANGLFLDPETGYSLDAGFEWQFLEEFTVGVNGYWMSIDDEIFLDPYAVNYGTGYGAYNCNSPARTRRIGFDSGIAWKRDKVAEASVKYSLVDAEFTSSRYANKDVPLVPSHRIRAEAALWLCDDLKVRVGWRFASSQRLAGDFLNEHGKIPFTSTFDVGAVYEPFWAKGWKASFVMDNVFDRNCCDFAGWSSYSGDYYYPSCGRSFMFTLSYEF